MTPFLHSSFYPLPFPKGVSQTPDGLRIRLRRGPVTFDACVPKTHANPLARALELLARFQRAAAAAKLPRDYRQRRAARSNTGHLGISETTKWTRSRPYPVLTVNWCEHHHKRSRMIYYHETDPQSRARALRQAIQFRRSKLNGRDGALRRPCEQRNASTFPLTTP